jgi:hypothetical protein
LPALLCEIFNVWQQLTVPKYQAILPKATWENGPDMLVNRYDEMLVAPVFVKETAP